MPKNVVPHKRSNHGHNLDYAPSKGVSTFTPKNTSFTVDYSSIKSEIFKKSPKFYAVQLFFFVIEQRESVHSTQNFFLILTV